MWPHVPFRGELHPRGRGGKFRDKPGTIPTPKGRGGRGRTDLPKIKSPEQSRLERVQAIGSRVVQAFRGKVPERALLTWYAMWSGYQRHMGGSATDPFKQDPTAILDWITYAQTSLRAVARAAAASPEIMSAIVRLVSAEYDDGEITPEELRLLEAHGLGPDALSLFAVPLVDTFDTESGDRSA